MKTNTRNVFVGVILMIVMLLGISMLTACNDVTLDKLQNEYGIVIDGGGFEEGSTLVSNEIATDTKEGAEVLAAIADQNYDKDGSIYIFDIYVTKDGAKVQPSDKVKVSVPVPNVQVDNYLVFHVKADNSVENLVPTVADGKISFETSSFSYFVIAKAAPAEHVHNYVWVEGTEPTCEKEGVVAHYHCDGCGKNFDPNYGEVETVSIPKAEHEYGSMYWGKSANFFHDGNIEYYQCAVCEKYFDEELNEVETVVIPKYSTNLSICVNGTPTALVLGEQHENFIEWSLEGLSVTKGDVITLCQTDHAEIGHNYFADGNVDKDGKILTTAAAANVVLTATPNGLTLFIDGYKYEGIVIEINGVQYPMNFVTYPDGEETSYVYGYVEFAVGDEFVIIDNVSGTVYDYDDLDEEFLWDTWDFHRGDNGEFVIDFAARYGIEFDNSGSKKIYIAKAFAPYDGESFGVVFESEREDEMLDSIELPTDGSADNEFMWTLTHCTTMNNADFVEYIDENGLWFYCTIIDIEEGEKFSLKDFTTGELIGADYLVDITGDITAVTREGDLVSVQKSGSFYIIYLPAFNSFTIDCDTSSSSSEINMYLDGEFISLIKEGEVVTYTNLEATTSTNILFVNGTFTVYYPITIDSQTDSAIAHVVESNGMSMLFFDKAGTYNISYNVETGVLSITSVGGGDEQGGGEEEKPTTYFYWLGILDSVSGSDETLMEQDAANENLYVASGVTMNANSYLMVGVYDNLGNETICYTLTETDPSIAETTDEKITVYIAGTYDVYFDIVAKTIKLIRTGDLPESPEVAVPKDIYISTMETYTLIENTENADELCYLGLVLESYDDFRIRDTDNNYISDITLASGTTGAQTSGSSVMVEADGTYNIYVNKTTHVVRIVAASSGGGEDIGGGEESGSIDDYIFFISVMDDTNGDQTLYPTKNPENPSELYVRVETIAANSYISVSAMSKADYSTTTYGTLANTDSSVASNLTAEIISVKVAGPIDIYFNFETKTVRIVAVS